MRVPQAPQKANPTCTGLPQVGQAISPPPAGLFITGAGVGAIAAGEAAPACARATVGAGVPTDAGPPFVPALELDPGPGVGPASGFGGSWNGIGSGIRGESFQGIPPRAFAPAGEGVRNSPATADAGGPGGSTVRAVSRVGSAAPDAVTTGPGVGPRPADGEVATGAAGFNSSLPQPRQNL